MDSHSNESKIILALQALQNNPDLTLRSAAKLYNVLYTTLGKRCAGRQSKCNWQPPTRKLTNSEEEAIV